MKAVCFAAMAGIVVTLTLLGPRFFADHFVIGYKPSDECLRLDPPNPPLTGGTDAKLKVDIQAFEATNPYKVK